MDGPPREKLLRFQMSIPGEEQVNLPVCVWWSFNWACVGFFLFACKLSCFSLENFLLCVLFFSHHFLSFRLEREHRRANDDVIITIHVVLCKKGKKKTNQYEEMRMMKTEQWWRHERKRFCFFTLTSLPCVFLSPSFSFVVLSRQEQHRTWNRAHKLSLPLPRLANTFIHSSYKRRRINITRIERGRMPKYHSFRSSYFCSRSTKKNRTHEQRKSIRKTFPHSTGSSECYSPMSSSSSRRKKTRTRFKGNNVPRSWRR